MSTDPIANRISEESNRAARRANRISIISIIATLIVIIPAYISIRQTNKSLAISQKQFEMAVHKDSTDSVESLVKFQIDTAILNTQIRALNFTISQFHNSNTPNLDIDIFQSYPPVPNDSTKLTYVFVDNGTLALTIKTCRVTLKVDSTIPNIKKALAKVKGFASPFTFTDKSIQFYVVGDFISAANYLDIAVGKKSIYFIADGKYKNASIANWKYFLFIYRKTQNSTLWETVQRIY